MAPQNGRKLVGGQDEDVCRRSVVAPEAEGRHERQALRPSRADGGELRGCHGAERMADQVGPLDAERGEELVVGQREIEQIVERLDTARARDTRMRRRVYAEGPGQEVEERRPRAALEIRMEIDQRRAPSGGEDLERHGAAPDLDRACVGHQATPVDRDALTSRSGHPTATSGPCSRATDRGRAASLPWRTAPWS